MSLNVGRISSSPTGKGFLLSFIDAVSHQNDALTADTLDEVVAFNNCFWFRIHVFFFWKTPKTCLLMQSAWSPSGKAFSKFHGFVGCECLHI